MSQTVWRPIKRVYCDKVGRVVALEARLVYPAELLPDGPPRVMGHRCSQAVDCNQNDAPTCSYAGSLPGYDPFAV